MKKTNLVETAPEEVETSAAETDDWPPEERLYTVHVVGRKSQAAPLSVTVSINKKELSMEVDTGASVSIISERIYNKLWKRQDAPGLRRPAVRLHTYSGETLEVLGELDVPVRCHGQVAKLPLIVVRGDGPSLLGRNWMESLVLPWQEILQKGHIRSIGTDTRKTLYTDLLQRYGDIFKEGIEERQRQSR